MKANPNNSSINNNVVVIHEVRLATPSPSLSVISEKLHLPNLLPLNIASSPKKRKLSQTPPLNAVEANLNLKNPALLSICSSTIVKKTSRPTLSKLSLKNAIDDFDRALFY